MNALAETKLCPMCAETIKAAAKKCPHCQSRQSWSALWGYELMVVGHVLLCVVLAIVMLTWLAPEEWRTNGRSFSPHRAELAVVRTSLASDPEQPRFWLSGFVTNHGSYAWRVREIEVRFLNPDGSSLDVLHPGIDNSFVVQPAAEAAFRVTLGSLPPDVVRASYQARVQNATDGNLARDPD